MKQFVCWGVGCCLILAPMIAASHQEKNKKTIIGRLETVCLAEWGIRIKAKIDTGAYRSSLNVSRLELLAGKPRRVRFDTTDQHGAMHTLEARVVKRVRVKSSSGHVEKRPLIQTRLRLGGQEFDGLVSLTDRSDMRYPMLIGRHFLKGRFLIDPARRHTIKNPNCPQPSSD